MDKSLAAKPPATKPAKRGPARSGSSSAKRGVKGWFAVRVQLTSGGDLEHISRGPGRIFLVGPEHTLEDLAVAIDLAFARWDLSHLNEFVFPDGRRYGPPDDDPAGPLFGDNPDDYTRHRVGAVVRKGEEFEYIFDLGAGWRHRCEVTGVGLDPEEVAGVIPGNPIPIWGWGSMPDQYGRRWETDTGENSDED